MSAAHTSEPQHPSPGRDRVPLWQLIGAFAASPAAWITQLLVNYGVASHACYPSVAPWLVSPPPGWAGERIWMEVLSLVCLAVALGGAGASWMFWKRTKDEVGGDAESAMEIGEGRTRFIASCGILFGLCFGIVILFQALQPILLASCWRVLS